MQRAGSWFFYMDGYVDVDKRLIVCDLTFQSKHKVWMDVPNLEVQMRVASGVTPGRDRSVLP